MKLRSKKKNHTKPLPYQDSTLPGQTRVKDLLARMTVEEKVAQMTCVWQEKSTKLLDANGHFDLKKPRRVQATATASARSAVPAMPAQPTDAGMGNGPRQWRS